MKKYRELLLFVWLTIFLTSPVIATARENSAQKLFNIDPLAQKTKLKTVYFVNATHGLITYIAMKNGWFNDANLDVELMPFVNGMAIMNAADNWDVGTAGAPPTIFGMLKHDVKVIGLSSWDDMLDLFVRTSHPIYKAGKGHIPAYPNIWGTPASWKDTTWLMPKNTAVYFVLLSTLKRMGLTERDVTVIDTDVGAALDSFKENKGDGIGVWNSLSVLATQSGFQKVSGTRESKVRMPCSIIATGKALREKRVAVKKFLEVHLATAKWVAENQDKAVDLYLQASKEANINTTREIGASILQIITAPELFEQIAYVKKKVADPQKPSQQIESIKEIMIQVFDFLASSGQYNKDDRLKLLSDGIDTSLILEIKSDYEKAGKKIGEIE